MLTLVFPGQLFRSSLNSVCTTADCVTAGERNCFFFALLVIYSANKVSPLPKRRTKKLFSNPTILSLCLSFPFCLCGTLKPLASCRTWINLWSLVIISTSTPAGVGWKDMSSQRRAPVTASLTFWGTSWRLSSKVSLIFGGQWAAACGAMRGIQSERKCLHVFCCCRCSWDGEWAGQRCHQEGQNTLQLLHEWE